MPFEKGNEAKLRHGHHREKQFGGRSPTYSSWANMWTRVRFSPYYRGISVDPRWSDFQNFLADMGERPDGMTLDRKENNKGYNKDNCRWATRREQVLNRRTALRYTFKGVEMPLIEIAEAIGISYKAIFHHHQRGTLERKLLKYQK